MDLFGLDAKKLAKFFVDSGMESYQVGVNFFKAYASVLPRDVSSKGIEVLNQGIQMVKGGDTYVFSVFDSWADGEGRGEGYHVYRKVGDLLERAIYLEHPNSLREILSYLQKEKIITVFTLTIPGNREYFGLSSEPDEDGDIFEYRVLDEEDIQKLSLSGIESIVLQI